MFILLFSAYFRDRTFCSLRYKFKPFGKWIDSITGPKEEEKKEEQNTENDDTGKNNKKDDDQNTKNKPGDGKIEENKKSKELSNGTQETKKEVENNKGDEKQPESEFKVKIHCYPRSKVIPVKGHLMSHPNLKVKVIGEVQGVCAHVTMAMCQTCHN